MKQFEYLQEQRLRVERLNELGKEGWELVSASPFIMKREIVKPVAKPQPKPKA